MPVTLHSMSENSVLFCEMREIWCRWGLSFGFICLLKIEVILRISDYVCVGLFKHYLKNNTASARWLPVVWRGWFRCDGKIIAYVTGTAFFAVQLNVLCALSDFQAVKWQLNVTEVLLVPAVMSADAFVSVCRPVYHTNLTHVAALISSFFFAWKWSCYCCHRVYCKHTRVFVFCRKARTVCTNVALCCPSLWRKKQFDLTSRKLWDFVGDDTLFPICLTSCFPVFIY